MLKKCRILKTLAALGLLNASAFVINAGEYDFTNYKGTLTRLYDGTSITIKSGYKVTFSPVDSGHKFTYYHYDGSTITPVKYYISTSFDASFGVILSRDTNASYIVDMIGNRNVATASSDGGALFNTGDGGNSNSTATRGHIVNLIGDFYGTNYGIGSTGGGGALANNGIIENIIGDFVSNTVNGEYKNADDTYGGAILNGVKNNNALNYIGSIKSNFINNGVLNGQAGIAGGGAIANFRGINSIDGDFIANYTINRTQMYGGSFGGAIYNVSGTIDSINGNFIGNYSYGSNSGTSAGGAINNFGIINKITGEFNGNWATGDWQAFAGAIYNQSTIGDIKANFTGNYATDYGGAISNFANGLSVVMFDVGVSDWDNVNDLYPAPQSLSLTPFASTIVSISSIAGDFVGNSTGLRGGAIHNSSTSTITALIGSISGNFKENYVDSTGEALGGAIYNGGTIGVISVNFIDNYAQTTSSSRLALGGAIYTTQSLRFLADGQKMTFSGNYTEDPTNGVVHNAIFVDTSASLPLGLNFEAKNKGVIVVDDIISGGEKAGNSLIYAKQYGITITGDNAANEGESSSKMYVKNDIINASSISVKDAELILNKTSYGQGTIKAEPTGLATPVTTLNLDNAVFHTANTYLEEVRLAGYSASNNSFWHLDVNPDTMTADAMHVYGNVEGTTQLVIHATSATDITNQGEIPFAYSYGDATGTDASFSIFRVYTSPYLYDVIYHENGLDKEWALVMNDTVNPDLPGPGPDPDPDTPTPPVPPTPDPDPDPDPKPPVIAPEVIAYVGLHTVAFEQTRNLTQNISNHLAMGKVYQPGACHLQEEAYLRNNSQKTYNAWVRPTYYNSNIKKPLHVDASIMGIDGGFDSQFNANHKAGLFLSYRNGNYDMDGISTQYTSPIRSKIDMDSYLSGAYYRYDKNCVWLFMAAYVGFHEADLKSYDGAHASTDGLQLGFCAETGTFITIGSDRSWTLEPTFSINYSQVDFDAIHDAYGKSAYYDVLRQVELALSLKLEKSFSSTHGKSKVYVTPSLVQPFTSGDKVAITNLGTVNTYHDELMGRVEVGAKYNLTERLHTYAAVNYTYGKRYDAYSANIGFNFSF